VSLSALSSTPSASIPDDDPLLQVYAKCRCGRRSTNVRIFASVAKRISEAELMDDGFKVGTWWCWRCQTIAILTARALHFSEYVRRIP
jgi:hypothetical protein